MPSYTLASSNVWQPRTELDNLCEIWRSREKQVIALVGFGGSGKSMIVERFLQILPNGKVPTQGVEKNTKLPGPLAFLPFCFYHANADQLFAELAVWGGAQTSLSGGEVRIGVGQILRLLLNKAADLGNEGRLLIVLDGLEEAQDAQTINGRSAKLQDGRLRELILEIASGNYSNIAIILTSRFSIKEVEERRSPSFAEMPIGKMRAREAVGLLRACGIGGPEVSLERIAATCLYHPFLLVLQARFNKQFRSGNALDWGNLSTETDAIAPSELGEELKLLDRLFSEIAAKYKTTLASAHAAALALLERITLFPDGVTLDTLANVFLGLEACDISGPALASLDKKDVQQELDFLVKMELVQFSQPAANGTVAEAYYFVHPAVSDGFKNGIAKDAASMSHKAIKENHIAKLGGIPNSRPTDPSVLVVIEKIIFHAAKGGYYEEAFEIYRNNLGFMHLGWNVGDYERGRRIGSFFTGSMSPSHAEARMKAVPVKQKHALLADWGGYFTALGLLNDAEAVCKFLLNDSSCPNEIASPAARSLAEVYFLTGQLPEALKAAKTSLELAEAIENQTEREKARRQAITRVANAQSLLGETDLSEKLFSEAESISEAVEFPSSGTRYSSNYVPKTAFLIRAGKSNEADAISKYALGLFDEEKLNQHQDAPRHRLFRAQVALQRDGDWKSAEDFLLQALAWIECRSSKEMLCAWHLQQAKVEIFKLKSDESLTFDLQRQRIADILGRLNHGLAIAQEHRFGLLSIDIQVERGFVYLFGGRPTLAFKVLTEALNGGHDSKSSMLGSQDQECSYVWGTTRALNLRAQSLLLEAAQKLQRRKLHEWEKDDPPVSISTMLLSARKDLEACEELCSRIKDRRTGEEVGQILRDLQSGTITKFQLAQKC